MRSRLSEAVVRCQLRRLRRVAGAAPLPVAGLAVIVALAPVALYRAGQALGAELAGPIDDAVVSDGIALGPLLAAMVAGAVLAASLPGRAALGAQIAAGPPGPFASILAITVVPAIGGALVVLPSLVALCVGLARALPGGDAAGLALAAAILAAVPVGAIVAEVAIAATRGRRRRAAVILASTVAWQATGSALGGRLLGPLALVPGALRGERSGWLALVVSAAVLILAGAAWVVLAATRPLARPRRASPRSGRSRARRVRLTVGLGLLLARRGDVRLATACAVVFGVGGTVLAAVAGAPPPSPFLLGTSTALLGALLCPLVVGGALADGRWLWCGAPVADRVVGVAAGLVGCLGAATPVAVVGAAAVIASGADRRTVGVAAALVIVGAALALLAGSLVPLRGAGAGDQLTTFAAFAALAVAMSLVTGLTAPRLASAGIPDPLVVGLVTAVALGGGLAGLVRRLGVAG